MPDVAMKPLNVPPTPDGYQYFNMVVFGTDGPVPPKPEPGPEPEPPLGIWGPTDPRPTHPIAGWNPGTGTWPEVPPALPGLPAGAKLAYVAPPPAGATPPAESAPDAKWMLLVMEKGSPPTWGKINPYASTGPVTPPAEGRQPSA